ncbi:hypothetical protein JMA_09340 [Jeotgalibacillus malaysiensis]|uniref:Phosphoglycerate mutase n=1 Tax=Jeotgalibacillus malaysiensis TaxID=1508404 RepID=A0A0B5AJM6_9BACL|nr:phosphoglycerate mutase family protein [Jeotgalibacillus malaysiensis]AJD90251.1 hypothetical protein JMA_09340 [Jeotgalibacillus malaysiensis]
MELIFIRHGQGEHTLNLPESLYMNDPALTQEGESQAATLQTEIPLTEKDILVVSPVRRTLQTAFIWSQGIHCRKIVNPFISPRMFPQKMNGQTLPCDQLLNTNMISEDFPDFIIEGGLPDELWLSGINTLPEPEFNDLAQRFLAWCKKQDAERILIVTHDGTITSHRQIIRNELLTREDFLKDGHWVKETLDSNYTY